jgi:pimeloyl-ACP methyl ester carboxylesterase
METESVESARRIRVPVAESVGLSVLAWRSDGSVEAAAPIVLSHGIASTARTWDPVARILAGAGHDVFAVDFRGHGESDAPDGGYDLATFASDLTAVTERLAGGRGDGAGYDRGDGSGDGRSARPVLIGHSLGAMTILEALKRAPDLAGGAGLVEGGLVDASVQFGSLDECLSRSQLPPVGGMPRARVEGYLRATNPGWTEERLAGTMAAFRTEPDGTVQWRLTAPRFESLIRSMWEQRAPELWPFIAAPTLIVTADTGDGIWTEQKRAASEVAEQVLPRVRVRRLKGDHDIQADRPAEVVDAILAAFEDGFFGRDES